ncbi:acyltransferase family protein [Thioclava sp. GXIMD4215]|uniref:acyltransferase family protein n=1 Tax=Thioclava sp. GXIMD4215 TaxID=3131928 RepID=UPI00324F6326
MPTPMPLSPSRRNTSIDALRLVAALGVIALHAGRYPEWPALAGDLWTSAFRWAVPFFLALSGYYLADSERRFAKITLPRITRICVIFALVWVLYLPVQVWRGGIGSIDIETLIRGSYFHMWFLSAMVMGFLANAAFAEVKAFRLAIALSLLILFANIAAGYINLLRPGRFGDTVVTLRQLTGLPCLMAGVALHRLTHWQGRHFLVILALGMASCLAEVLVCHRLGLRAMDLQWGLHVPLITLGLLGTALRWPDLAPRWMARWGLRDSLTLYLLHPLALLLVAALWTGHPVKWLPPDLPGLLLWASASVITVLAAAIIAKLPLLNAFMNGDLSRLLAPTKRTATDAHRAEHGQRNSPP